MLTMTLSTTRKRHIAVCLLTFMSALGHSAYAADTLEVSNLPVTYLSASSSSELLARAENKSLDFLNSVSSKGDPEFCNKQVQGGLKVFETVIKMIPGTGDLSDLIKIGTGMGVAATCKNGGGLAFTWDQIMDAIDTKIDTALSDLQRKQMRDLYGYFSLEFESRTDRLRLADKGLLSQTDILVLINELSNIVRDIEQAEAMLNVGSEWSQISFLPYLYTLKYNIHLVLAELYPMQHDLQQTAVDHLNLQMEQSRIRAVQGIARAYKDHSKFFKSSFFANASYQFEKDRSGFYSTWRRKYTLQFYSETGEETVYKSSCNGNPCGGITANTWYNRRDRILRDTVETLEKLWSDLFATRDDTYRDFVDSTNYFKGQQLFFVAGATRKPNSLFSSYCLRPAISSGDITALETKECSFGEYPLARPSGANRFHREGLIDSWRVHDKTGLVINEATGLCLNLAEDKKTLRLSPCQYALDPEREQRSTQEWAILEYGLVINRNTGECLNTPEESDERGTQPSFPTLGSHLEMQACDIPGMKNYGSVHIDLGVKVYKPNLRQDWRLVATKDCDDLGVCSIADSVEVNMPTRRVQTKTRLVLPADGIDQFAQAATLDTSTPGFTDTGFLSLSTSDDKATWKDLEIIAGLYKLTVVYQGVNANAPAAPQLKLEVNGQTITDQLLLAPVAAGATASAEFAIDIPAFGQDLAISAVGSDGHYLIDKLILSPLAEE